jgi:hypothetical protein
MNTAVIKRTIDVPENREVKFTLPQTVPSGQAYITVTIAPKIAARESAANMPWFNPSPDKGKEKDWRSFRGCLKSDGHEVERFLERQIAEREFEDELDERNI